MPNKPDAPQQEEIAPPVIKMENYVRDVINKHYPRLNFATRISKATTAKLNYSASTLKTSFINVKCFLDCNGIKGEKTHCFSCYELKIIHDPSAFIRMKIRSNVMQLIDLILKMENKEDATNTRDS